MDKNLRALLDMLNIQRFNELVGLAWTQVSILYTKYAIRLIHS